jgi:hypothetical protein
VERSIASICEQAIEASTDWRANLSDSPAWEAAKSARPEEQMALAIAAIDPIRKGARTYSGNSWKVETLRKQILSQILRRKLPWGEQRLVSLLERTIAEPYSLQYGSMPVAALLGAIERHVTDHGLSKPVEKLAALLKRRLEADNPYRQRPDKWTQGILGRLAPLLDPASAAQRPLLPPGAFGTAFTTWIEAQGNGGKAWLALAIHAAGAGDKSGPAKSWLAEADRLLCELGSGPFAAGIRHWLQTTLPDPAAPDNSLDILKGLIWITPLAEGEGLAGSVGRFAELCFKKIRGLGARSVKLGNAALYALSEMAEQQQAGAELFRLRTVVKYPSARKIIDKRLEELAARRGEDLGQLEDRALPDYGLRPDATLSESFGEARATLALSSTETAVQWFNEAGKPVKAPSAAIREHFKDALASFKQTANDIDRARASQSLRLEQSWVEGRTWRFAEWSTNYLAHPLRRPIVETLLWIVTDNGRESTVLPRDGELRDINGNEIGFCDDAQVRLWHPLHQSPEDVLAWRARIQELEITQPLKQVHREVYVLTDAERATNTYSNRFAAHILRQHQFRALCQARGWRFEFLGGWDNWNVPTRDCPSISLRVEYSVEPMEDDQRSDSWVPLHLASDQVRFFETGAREPLRLEQVEPIVFSELMRDIDLFVAVTSVANDPEWRDGGPDGRFGAYWREWSFGELGQSAATRKDLIAAIAPRLSIAGKLQIGDKALIVTGKRQKYAIHFGSTNIQILPDNRYLCIVPDRDPKELQSVRLPFTGDTHLSTILAKAFMLVDEDRIADPTILRQL